MTTPTRSALPALLAACLCTPAALVAADFTARDGGPSQNEMLARGDAGLPGLAFVRPVLDGVLYRAGFKGGDKGRTGLSEAQRGALCEAGFSGARYADFGTKTRFGTTRCGGNSLEYAKVGSGNGQPLMKDIHAVIENPDRGPILVHCMWGVHSSGALSAMALMQFCGWSEDRAKAYWDKARNNAPCGGGCDAWIDAKLKRFKVDPALSITAEQRERICPE
jgi:hypothetical protein